MRFSSFSIPLCMAACALSQVNSADHVGSIYAAGSDNWVDSGLAVFDDQSVSFRGQFRINQVWSSEADAGFKLVVNGNIKTRGVVVTANGWADHVFADSYKLASLENVEQFIKAERHLPGVPSEKAILKNGIDLNAMMVTHMTKIEELTLYAIDQKKTADGLRAENLELQRRLEKIERALGLAGK